jgi:protein phosphatase
LAFVAHGETDTGRRRPHNEDSVGVEMDAGLFIVADGMGGHAAGEVASRAAVHTLSDFVVKSINDHNFTWPFGFEERLTFNENLMQTATLLANRKVCQIAEENSECLGMGTTLAAMVVREQQAVIAHVGDSRVYRFRGSEMDLLTTDHSWVNEQLQRNVLTEEEARTHRWRNVITRALGNRPDIDADLRSVATRPGDLFLLCTDGLTTMVDDLKIAQILDDPKLEPEAGCRALIDAANEAGGADNISVILVRIQA